MSPKKQPIARTLLRRLAARLELERSLGAEFLQCRLGPPADLSRIPEGASATPKPAPIERAPAQSVPNRPATQPAAKSVPAVPAAPAAHPAAHGEETLDGNALAQAMGGHLPDFDTAPIDEAEAATRLTALRDEALVCKKCRLCEARQKVVFGCGSFRTDLVFVGEAPGRDEDIQGEPFVGRAGQLLTAMVEKGMKRPRASVYICNIIKCRPPRNRTPLPDEIGCCVAYLHEQLNIIRPKLVVALGRVAAIALTGTVLSMKRLRGRFFRFRGIPVLPTYHPAYLLRERSRQNTHTQADRETWDDLKAAMQFLNDVPPTT